jgi:hypothetical protein
MPFTAPIWLVLLIPWGMLAIWMLIGRHPRAVVPFLPLWDLTLAAP